MHCHDNEFSSSPDCQFFYLCIEGKARRNGCSDGSVFDPNTLACERFSIISIILGLTIFTSSRLGFCFYNYYLSQLSCLQKVFHDGSLSLSLLPIGKTVASQRVSTHLKTLQSSPLLPFVLDLWRTIVQHNFIRQEKVDGPCGNWYNQTFIESLNR